jgi:hypothetical protein
MDTAPAGILHSMNAVVSLQHLGLNVTPGTACNVNCAQDETVCSVLKRVARSSIFFFSRRLARRMEDCRVYRHPGTSFIWFLLGLSLVQSTLYRDNFSAAEASRQTHEAASGGRERPYDPSRWGPDCQSTRRGDPGANERCQRKATGRIATCATARQSLAQVAGQRQWAGMQR